VCSIWNHEAIKLLKSKAQIRFFCDAHVKTYIINLSRHYTCSSYEFGSEVTLNSSWMQKFWWKFGNSVTSLKFHHSCWTGPDIYEILFDHVPKLEELSIRLEIPQPCHFLPPDPNARKVLEQLRILNLSFAVRKGAQNGTQQMFAAWIV